MKNSTRQSNPSQAENFRQHSQHRPGARKPYKPAVLDARLFYDPADGHGQRWEQRCIRKRDLWQALLYISHGNLTTRATEAEFAKLMRCDRRTARRGMRDLLAQGFAKNIRKHGYKGDMERELLPGRIGKYEAPPSKHARTRVRTSTATGVRVTSFGEVHSEKADTADTAKTAAGIGSASFESKNKETASFEVKTSLDDLDWSKPENQEATAPRVEHTPQSAFDTAVRIFRLSTWFEISDPYAVGLAFWIASRALRASGKHPLVVAYYVKSAENFFEQYSEAQQTALMLGGPDRYQAEIDRLHGRPARKRPHRDLSAAEKREAKNEEVLERVFGCDRIEESGEEPEPRRELERGLGRGYFKPESIEEYEARLAEYAAAHPDDLVALKLHSRSTGS